MNLPVNDCYTLLRGDGILRPDIQSYEVRQSDGATRCKGWMRGDTPEALRMSPRPSDVPFDLVVPAGLSQSEFHFKINVPVYYHLKNGESLMGLDFTPPPPPPTPVQVQPNWGGALVFALGAVVLTVAFGSRN